MKDGTDCGLQVEELLFCVPPHKARGGFSPVGLGQEMERRRSEQEDVELRERGIGVGAKLPVAGDQVQDNLTSALAWGILGP